VKRLIHFLIRGASILAGTILFLSIPRLFYVEGKKLIYGPEFFL
jgi:hypothetical protein